MTKNKEQKHIVFEEIYPGLSEHALPLVREFITQEHRVCIACFSKDKCLFEEHYQPFNFGKNLQIQSFDSFDWNKSIDAMLSTVPGSPGPLFRDVRSPLNIPRVAMPHGLTDKNNKFPAHFIGHPLGYFNVLLASGEAMYSGSWETYEKKHPQVRYALKHLKTGVPKTDRLFQKTLRRGEILRQLGLDPLRETVLYAPTFQEEASLEQFGEEIIPCLAKTGINLLVRLHHLSAENWGQRLQEWEKQYTNMRHVKGDSTPWFIAADLLIGDVSGACYEFMVQNKPVLFIDSPAFFENHGRDGIAYWGREAGEIITDLAHLEKAVFTHLDQPGLKRGQREKLIDQLLYRQGDSAKFCVNALLDLIQGNDSFPTWGPTINQREDILLEEAILQRLHGLALANKRVALYGKGAHTQRLFRLMKKGEKRNLSLPQILCILDDQTDGEETIDGISVRKPHPESADEIDILILSTDYFQETMKQQAHALWKNKIQLIDLYENFPWHRPDSLDI